MVIPETEGSLRNTDDHDRRLSLIDVSSADDSLIANPFHQHQHSENEERAALLYTPNSRKFENAATKLEQWEQEPQPNETFEIEKSTKNSKCNLRKSLAWDSAFFTSAGVLDPDELSSIIEGVEKNEKRALPLLPGIEEDVHKSCESISTLESDSLTLESLEPDLFEDVRASIQKSGRKLNATSASSMVPSGFQTGGDSSKKVGMASRNKMKASSSKSPSASLQGIGKMTKKNPIFPQLLQKPVTTRGEPSILKQPKVLGKSSSSSTISSKRASLGDQHVKSEKDKAKRIISGKVSSVSNTSVIRGSRVIAPKPILPSKSASGLSVTSKTKSTTSTSSGGILFGNIGKSPLNSLERKVDSGTKKPLSNCTAVRTSKIGSRDKSGSSDSSLSSLLSVTKLSSSISPVSSLSDWSSESSSSTSMAKYRSNSSRTSFDRSFSRKQLLDTHAQQGSNSQDPQSDSRLEENETQHAGFISQCGRTAAAGMVLPPAPMKPSGLRLPSPKIGFFDGVKSSVRTPRGGMQQQSVIPRSLPKQGVGSVSPNEGQNKAKLGKLQPARSIKSIENKKFSNQQTSHPIPLHESSDVATKTSDLQNVKSSSEVPMEVQNKTHPKTGAGNVEANNTVAEGHLIGIYDLNLGSTQDNGTLDNSIDIIDSEIKGSTRSVDTRATSTNEKLNRSEYVESTSSSKVAGECLLYDHSNYRKAEGPTLINHDIGKHTSDMCSTENKEVVDISTDKMSPEGSSGMHSHNNGATITNADYNPCVSSATENLENTSCSHVVEKAPVFCQLDLINNLHPFTDNQDNPHYDDQLDCLSRQVGLLDINLGAQKKFNGHSLSFSQPDVSFQDKSDGLGL